MRGGPRLMWRPRARVGSPGDGRQSSPGAVRWIRKMPRGVFGMFPRTPGDECQLGIGGEGRETYRSVIRPTCEWFTRFVIQPWNFWRGTLELGIIYSSGRQMNPTSYRTQRVSRHLPLRDSQDLGEREGEEGRGCSPDIRLMITASGTAR